MAGGIKHRSLRIVSQSSSWDFLCKDYVCTKRHNQAKVANDMAYASGWLSAGAAPGFLRAPLLHFRQQHLFWAVSVVCCFVRPDALPTEAGAMCHIETSNARRIDATLTEAVYAPDLSAQGGLIITAVPPELDRQKNVSVRFTIDSHLGQLLYQRDSSPFARPLVFLPLAARADRPLHTVCFKVDYRANLCSRRLVWGPPAYPVQPLSSGQRACYLQSSEMVDWTSEPFQAWLSSSSLRRLPEEHDILFAYRVLEAIVARGRYAVSPEMQRKPSMVCRTSVSDCGGLSLLFVAILRANGIPARTLWGRWAIPGTRGSNPYFHVKAEFYAKGVGWVPVDPSMAVMSRCAPAHFGQDAGDFLVLHEGTDIHITSDRFGMQRIKWLPAPLY